MNQILSFGKDKNTNGTGNKPVIRFFTIIIIVFALILIGEGAYNMYFGKDKNVANAPTISATQSGSSVIIVAENRTGIDKVIYYWNNGEQAIIYANGNSKIQEKVLLPIGTNKLNLSIVDTNGKMTKFAPQEFVFDSSIDSSSPDIQIAKGKNTGTIKVVVTDDRQVKSVTYQWDQEDVVTPQLQLGEPTVEFEIAAKEGEKTLKITAIDASDNEETITKIIKGSKKPEISVSKEGQNLIVKVTDDDKIGKIEYDFNGTTKTIEDINEAIYELKLDLVSGENYVIVTAYDIDGLAAKYKGKCNY